MVAAWMPQNVMSVPYAGDTHTHTHKKLVQVVFYQKLARVSVSLVQVFLVEVSCMQLNTALLQHRSCPACDTNRATWFAGGLFWCKKLWWTCVKFLCQFLVQVSWACVAGRTVSVDWDMFYDEMLCRYLWRSDVCSIGSDMILLGLICLQLVLLSVWCCSKSSKRWCCLSTMSRACSGAL